jgi:hypothetical protein
MADPLASVYHGKEGSGEAQILGANPNIKYFDGVLKDMAKQDLLDKKEAERMLKGSGVKTGTAWSVDQPKITLNVKKLHEQTASLAADLYGTKKIQAGSPEHYKRVLENENLKTDIEAEVQASAEGKAYYNAVIKALGSDKDGVWDQELSQPRVVEYQAADYGRRKEMETEGVLVPMFQYDKHIKETPIGITTTTDQKGLTVVTEKGVSKDFDAWVNEKVKIKGSGANKAVDYLIRFGEMTPEDALSQYKDDLQMKLNVGTSKTQKSASGRAGAAAKAPKTTIDLKVAPEDHKYEVAAVVDSGGNEIEPAKTVKFDITRYGQVTVKGVKLNNTQSVVYNRTEHKMDRIKGTDTVDIQSIGFYAVDNVTKMPLDNEGIEKLMETNPSQIGLLLMAPSLLQPKTASGNKEREVFIPWQNIAQSVKVQGGYTPEQWAKLEDEIMQLRKFGVAEFRKKYKP